MVLNIAGSFTALSVSNGEFIYVACAGKIIRHYPVKTSRFENILASNIKRDFTKEEWNTYTGVDVPNN